jgi:hypothetical protein
MEKEKTSPHPKKILRKLYTKHNDIFSVFVQNIMSFVQNLRKFVQKQKKEADKLSHLCRGFQLTPCTSLSFSAAKTTGNFYTSISSGSKSA